MAFNGKWIWDDGDPCPRNKTLNFRRSFELSTLPEAAVFSISADCRYLLYVNGERIGNGPARAYQFNYQYDTYDLRPYVRIGQNVIALSVVHWGIGTFHHLAARGGLLAQFISSEISFETDAEWRVQTNPALNQNTLRISCQLPWEEQFDARLEPVGWTNTPFDDTDWAFATEVGPYGIAPWGKLSPRTVPHLSNERVAAVNVTRRGVAKCPDLVLSLNLQPYVAPNNLRANLVQIDALIGTTLSLPQPANVVIKKCLIYGAPPDILVDGEVLEWLVAENEMTATCMLEGGNHSLLIDWQAESHDLDFTLAMSNAPGITAKSIIDVPAGVWSIITTPDHEVRNVARNARAPENLGTCGDWKPILPRDTPDIDAYMEISASTMIMPARENQSFPIEIASVSANHSQQYLIDFGREVIGWIEIDLNGQDGVILDVVGFEAIQNGTLRFAQQMNNSFRYIARNGHQCFTSTIRRGFRYLLLSAQTTLGGITLHAVNVRQATYPITPKGHFRCSDPRLNAIWEVCAYTERLCSEDVFSADATYEQTLWVGDAFNQLLTHQVVYGEPTLPDATFRLCADSLQRTPIVNSQVPSAWENKLIPNWSWLWAIGCERFYWFTGDLQFARDLYPSLAKQAHYALEVCRKSQYGLFEMFDAWHFLDWTPIDSEPTSIITHENCLLVAAFRATADMAVVVGQDNEAAKWRQAANELADAINRWLWSDAQQAYVDCVHQDGTASKSISQPTNVMALYSEVARGARAKALEPYVVSHPSHWVTSGSPFMMYFNLEVLARAGRFDELLHLVRQRWGDMLDRGATSTWETFPASYPDLPGRWTRSWCHAWSAIPTYFLSTYILGIIPTVPGYRQVEIKPQFSDLTWASGAVPTVSGMIRVAWETNEGQTPQLTIEVPPECVVEP